MNEQTRYRVTGSLFLFALAVVILPMLFDGDGLPAVEVPEFPDVAVSSAQVAAGLSLDVRDKAFIKETSKLRENFDDEGFHSATGTRHGDPILRPISASSEVFAVQLGTFDDEDNALTLRDRARQDGYEAFTSQLKNRGRRQIRVAVGPFLDQGKADAIRIKLSARYGLNARLMAIAETQNGHT